MGQKNSFLTDETLEFFVKESNIYHEKILKEKFGDNHKEIIFAKNSYNTYPYLYITKGKKILCQKIISS